MLIETSASSSSSSSSLLLLLLLLLLSLYKRRINSPQNYNSVLIYYSRVVPDLYNMFVLKLEQLFFLIVTPIKKDTNAP